VLVALAALPVVFTLLRTRKPELGTPQLALSLRVASIVAHVLAGVLIIGTAVSEIWLSLDAAGRWLFGIYGAAAAIALLGIFAFYLSFVAELPPPPPKPIKAKKPKKRRLRRKKAGEEAETAETAEAEEAEAEEADETEAAQTVTAETEAAEEAGETEAAEDTAEAEKPAATEPTRQADRMHRREEGQVGDPLDLDEGAPDDRQGVADQGAHACCSCVVSSGSALAARWPVRERKASARVGRQVPVSWRVTHASGSRGPAS
ncbi:hypothetical protein, partial [Janibacter melonis]|uniref:hypothetical protein n=1 Tax=Janibacter melonis TaxID=262209 RepID=UPI00296AE756